MSSSNSVSVVYNKEAEYGKRIEPSAGTVMNTCRFTSESLSGTPTTTESTEIRQDRLSAGQVATGLEVGGAVFFEVARDVFHDDFLSGAMMSNWVAAETQNTSIDLVPDGVDEQKAVLTLGTDFANLIPGTLVQLDDGNGGTTTVMITTVDTPSTVFTVATFRGQAAISTTGDVSLPQHIDIDSKTISFLIGKSYEDVLHLATQDQHSQTYTGELVSGFTIDATYGEIANGSYTLAGNGYTQEAPSYQQQVVTAGGTVNPAGTSTPVNASIDAFVWVDDVASDFCIQSLSLTLDNGLEEVTCIGVAAPTSYTLGTAAVSASLTVHNSDTAYDTFMANKMTQVPVSVTFLLENPTQGGYAFTIEALQVNFPDPSADGQNEQVTLDMEGVGKVGENGESSLRIWKL